MKLLKITFAVFVATLLVTTIRVSASSPITFAGLTISKSSTNYPYVSNSYYKSTTASQSFYLSSCKDKTFWADRNLDLAIRSNGTSVHTTTYAELEVGDTYTFTDAFTKIQDNFSLALILK